MTPADSGLPPMTSKEVAKLPCPFCGHSPYFNERGYGRCKDRGCPAGKEITHVDTWNRRALPISTGVTREELIAHLQGLDDAIEVGSFEVIDETGFQFHREVRALLARAGKT